MRPNREVMVAADAPGNLRKYGGWLGTVTSVTGRIATVVVRMPITGAQEVINADARHLVRRTQAGKPLSVKPVDTPEMIALKTKIAREAKELARQHNLCDVIDEALRRVGIEPLPNQMVEITLRIPEEEFGFDGEDIDEGFGGTVADQLEMVFETAATHRRRLYVKDVKFDDYTDLEKEDYE